MREEIFTPVLTLASCACSFRRIWSDGSKKTTNIFSLVHQFIVGTTSRFFFLLGHECQCANFSSSYVLPRTAAPSIADTKNGLPPRYDINYQALKDALKAKGVPSATISSSIQATFSDDKLQKNLFKLRVDAWSLGIFPPLGWVETRTNHSYLIDDESAKAPVLRFHDLWAPGPFLTVRRKPNVGKEDYALTRSDKDVQKDMASAGNEVGEMIGLW